MAKRLELSGEALADLREIRAYIGRHNPVRAKTFAAELLRVSRKLSDFPEAGRQARESRDGLVREITHGSYRIFYEVKADAVEILRYWHAARGTPKLRD